MRSATAAQAASKVATIPEVREALLDFQRAFAQRAGGAVLDGRDIGTVICPEAEAKLFVTASPEVRAHRRHAELRAAGSDMTYPEVLEDVRQRDARDRAVRDAAGTAEAAAGEALLPSFAVTSDVTPKSTSGNEKRCFAASLLPDFDSDDDD